MTPIPIPGCPPKPISRRQYYRRGIVRTYHVVRTVVAKRYGCTPEELNCTCRNRQVKEARQIVMCIGHKFLKLSQVQAGLPFSRHHSTVNHSVRVVRDLYQVDRSFRSVLDGVMEELRIKEYECIFKD